MSNNKHTREGNVTYMHTPQTIELDGRALKAEADKSHEFLTLVYYGANRERNREVTDIEQMRKGLEGKHQEDLDPGRWLEAFKKLEDMGMGALVMGRRGNPNRFRWNYSLKSIGTAAMNASTVTAHRIAPRMKGGRVVNDYHSSQPSRITVNVKHVDKEREVVVPLQAQPSNVLYVTVRPDYIFEADIPNLTEKEADVVCSAIRRCVK